MYDAVVAKLDRAVEHQDQFEQALDEWVERRPVGVQGRKDPRSDWFVMTFVFREPPPIRLGAIFGDMLNNLRGALDHLVWQLVLANQQTPTERNAFPVVTDPLRWPGVRGDKLKGVSNRFANDIKAIQPFHEGRQATFHWLYLLNQMNNINKHRVIAPMVVSEFEWEPTFELSRPAEVGDQVVNDLHPPAIGAFIEDGQVLRRVRVTSPRNDLHITKIQEEIPGRVGISFDHGIDLQGRAFPDYIEFVRRTISKFESALKP